MSKPDINIYQLSWDHYDATLSPEYIELCFMPIRRLIKDLVTPGGGSLLDLCCGTGMIAELFTDFEDFAYLGVDINREFLNRARERTAGYQQFRFQAVDLLADSIERSFDIALICNGYHHFPNPVKHLILEKIESLLKPGGALVVFEMCIATHQSTDEFRQVNADFYDKRIGWVEENESMSAKKLAGWRNVRDLSIAAEDEYKVDYGYLVRDFQRCGFFIEQETRIWPPPGERLFDDPKVGEFLFLFRNGF